uniref:Predicted protein n=1 Tax=Hordeum vulgare subsp. vulgare TaxID=112509 RepID=F2E4H5_HORVV|nr:predicted protein [Hordeum vulgare subsp. vulgare]
MDITSAINQLKQKASATSDDSALESIYNDLATLLHTKQILGSSKQATVPSARTASAEFDRVESPLSPVEDGCFSGALDGLSIEVRVDSKRGIVSADIRNNRAYVGSIRTDPGATYSPVPFLEALGIIGEDRNYNTTKGTITLLPGNSTKDFTFVIQLKKPLMGILTRDPVRIPVNFKTKFFREINIKYIVEKGLRFTTDSFAFRQRQINLQKVFEIYGINLNISIKDSIEASSEWDTSAGFSALYETFTTHSNIPVDNESWDVCIMHLGSSNEAGLLGVMFDDRGRRALAVFAGEIEDRFRANSIMSLEAKILQTTAHELGHALNLAHRFERGVGRADSLSCMNYSWRFSQGGDSAYWQGFDFVFDGDEISFLLHAPLYKIIFGGLEFHQVNYWVGNGVYSPYLKETLDNRFTLDLHSPAQTFPFGEPVILEASLAASQPQPVPAFMLDIKAGFLEILVTKVPAVSPFAEATPEVTTKFKPLMRKCYDSFEHHETAKRQIETVTISTNSPLKQNINVHFGSSGFAFAQPGTYRITAILSTYQDQRLEQEYIVKSNIVTIRIEYPHNSTEEEDVNVLMRPDVGRFIATGGNSHLEQAEVTKLEDSVLRRKNLVGVNRALLLSSVNNPRTSLAKRDDLIHNFKSACHRLDETTRKATVKFISETFGVKEK